MTYINTLILVIGYMVRGGRPQICKVCPIEGEHPTTEVRRADCQRDCRWIKRTLLSSSTVEKGKQKDEKVDHLGLSLVRRLRLLTACKAARQEKGNRGATTGKRIDAVMASVINMHK